MEGRQLQRRLDPGLRQGATTAESRQRCGRWGAHQHSAQADGVAFQLRPAMWSKNSFGLCTRTCCWTRVGQLLDTCWTRVGTCWNIIRYYTQVLHVRHNAVSKPRARGPCDTLERRSAGALHRHSPRGGEARSEVEAADREPAHSATPWAGGE